jgi:hypothetical protein
MIWQIILPERSLRFLAAALAATIAISVPIIARLAQDDAMQVAQVAQADEQSGEEHGGEPLRSTVLTKLPAHSSMIRTPIAPLSRRFK